MYNEEEACQPFFARVLPIVRRAASDFEIVCVNDGSRDGTLTALKAIRAQEPRVKIVNLTRNFGKEIALSAGLEYATGDAVVPIDADLQDPPELIPKLVAKWREGYDIVLAVRSKRSGDTLGKRMTANLFYRVMRRLSDVPIPQNAGDFRLVDRRVVEALKRLPERTRFMKGLFAWAGFSQATVPYERPPRVGGEGKWKYWRLWNFALEGIFSFTTLPLRIWTYFGLAVALLSMLYMTYTILKTLILGVDIPGYASIITLILFFSGINMIGLGMLGEYLGRVFTEVKQRPLYLVLDTIGFEQPARLKTEAPSLAQTSAL
jgi:glycosyltransferase involved in cell wall biosynthesis